MPDQSQPGAHAFDHLAAFARLPATTIFRLAPRPTIERGTSALEDRMVQRLGWDPETQQVWGTILDPVPHSVTLAVSGDTLRATCDCPNWSRTSNCRHAIAVASALFLVLRGSHLGTRRPPPAYVQRLAAGLLARPTSAGHTPPEPAHPAQNRSPDTPPPQATLLLQHDATGNLGLMVQGTLPRHFDAPDDPGPRARGTHHPLWIPIARADTLGHLVALSERARAAGVPIVHERRGRPILVSHRATRARCRLALDAGPHGNVSAETRFCDHAGKPLEPALPIGRRAALLENGALVGFADTAAGRLLDLLEQIDPGEPRPLSPETFNRHALRFATRDWTAALGALALLRSGQPAPAPDPANPTLARLELHAERHHAGRYTMRVACVTDTATLPLEEPRRALVDLWLARDLDPRLAHNRARVRALVQCALRLHDTPDPDGRDTLVQETTGDPAFDDFQLRDAAGRFLQRYLALWLDPAPDFPLRLQLFPGDTGAPWQLVHFPAAAYARLCLALRMPETRDDFAHLGAEIEFDQQSLSRFVLGSGFARQGGAIPFLLGRRPIEPAPVEVGIEIAETTEIDWFELRAEVRCAAFSIPQSQWEKLIRGQLILEREGRLILPQLPATSAVDCLRKLSAARDRAPDARGQFQPVPRHGILRWISLRRSGARVTVPAAVEAVLESLRRFEGIPDTQPPAALCAHLRDYQRRGFEWLLFLYRHRFGACLADDMGLGKTLQAIALMAALHEERAGAPPTERAPHLVVVPASLAFNWHAELARFCPALHAAEHLGPNRDWQSARKADVILTTYDILRRDIATLERERFDLAIFDETQIVKNFDAERTRAARRVQARFVLCMTGTPLENHAGEYCAILDLALPGLFEEPRAHGPRTPLPTEEIVARARPFVLRRTKAEVLAELPPKTEHDVHLDMDPSQKELYTRTVGEVRAEVLESFSSRPRAQAGIAALAALLRLRQICISPAILGHPTQRPAPKIAYLLDRLAELEGEGHAALVFSQFVRALDQVAGAAATRGLTTLRMHGGTPTATRKRLVQQFQAEDGPRIFLISLKTGGVGLNLTRANYVFHLDPWWNPAAENQASDRAHRIGQNRAVFVQRILMRHTIEEKMMVLKEQKRALFEQIVGAAETAASKAAPLTREDFEFLLS